MKDNFKKTNMGKRLLAMVMTMVMAFGAFSPVMGLADEAETTPETPVAATNTTATVTLDGKVLDATKDEKVLNALGLKVNEENSTSDIIFSVANSNIFQTSSNLRFDEKYTLSVAEGYVIKSVSGSYTYKTYISQGEGALNISEDFTFSVPNPWLANLSLESVKLNIKIEKIKVPLEEESTVKVLVDGGEEGQNITGLTIFSASLSPINNLGDFDENNKTYSLNELVENTQYTVALSGNKYEIDSIEVTQGKETLDMIGELSFKTKENSQEAVKVVVKLSTLTSNMVRVSGKERYLTALEVAKESYGNKVENIVIASGTDKASADALAVGPLANELNAPILLVNGGINEEVLKYIENSGVKNIYVAGGKGSVSDSVLTQILTKAELKNTDVTRFDGKNRYQTSLKIAEELWAKHDYNKTVILAHGTITADALAASTYATQEEYPIILTDSKALDPVVKTGLETAKVTEIVPVGGDGTLPDTIITASGIKAGKRIAGKTREATSVEIANKLTTKNSVIIANGYKGAVDALSAASLAQVEKAPIILTGSELTTEQENLIKSINGSKRYTGYAVGGTKYLTVKIFDDVDTLIAGLEK